MNREKAIDPRRLWRWLLQGVALGGVATVAVFFATVRDDTWEQLRLFNWRWLPLMMGLVVIAWLCNGGRVWLLCRALGHPLRYRQALAVSLSSEFGIAATPAGVGGTVIRLSLLGRAGVPVARSGSMLATDAAIDLLFFALLTPFALYVLLHDRLFGRLLEEADRSQAPEWFVGGLVTLAAVALLLKTTVFHRQVQRLAGLTSFGRRHRLAARHRYLRLAAARTLRRMGEALRLLWGRRKGALVANFALASVQWSCRYSLLPLVLFALGSAINPLPLFLVQGLLFMLSLLVVAPGGGGSVEVLAAVVLPSFAPIGVVALVVVLWRLLTYHLYLLGGGIAFFLTFRHLDTLFPRAPVTAPLPSNQTPSSS
jgi:uncharacterized protein (TIRG00374 family)